MRLSLSMLLAAAALMAPPAHGESLGVFNGWGAFRDARGPRCYAIAQPDSRAARAAGAFASIGYFPRARVRGQFQARLSRPAPRGARLVLEIGERRFALTGSAATVWAPDSRSDAAIIAAMRAAPTMRIVVARGAPIDRYALRGAATAIDAAALRCARSG